MNTLRTITLLTAVATLASAHPLRGQDIVYSHNAGESPSTGAFFTYGIGWSFTPASDIFLTAIQTRFGGRPAGAQFAYEQRDVTVELRDGINGTVLRSSTFASSANVAAWVGGTFGGYTLQGGTGYFIDFLNVADVNGVSDGGYLGNNELLAAPSGGFSDFASATSFGDAFYPTGGDTDPIIRFTAPAMVTPEPASLLLLAIGLAGLGALRRRRGPARDAG